jgi:hypothetical protein
VATVSQKGPKGVVLPVSCKIVGSESFYDPNNSAVVPANHWLIDCGTQRHDLFIFEMQPLLRDAGWKLCEIGIDNAVWWKDGVNMLIGGRESGPLPVWGTIVQFEKPECPDNPAYNNP